MTNVVKKSRLYVSTVSHLQPGQIVARLQRAIGLITPIKGGYKPTVDLSRADISRVPAFPELDFDQAFLGRFDVDAILDDRLGLLNHEETVDWSSSWREPLSTPLWRFNLHYHEYLLPLAKVYIDKGDTRYLKKAKTIVESWISSCPRGRGGDAWHPYVISMRVVNWLAFLGELKGDPAVDQEFTASVNASLAEQYVHLSQRLEKDLLANHYLENLKALTILSCYFSDDQTLSLVLPMLKAQVSEQILPDGMHFELSPMYHKIVLEDLMRVVCALRATGIKGNLARDYRIQDMCDVLWSLEGGCDRTPLFNDAGDNVAKSRDALLRCAKDHLGVFPNYVSVLPDAGYAILERVTKVGHVKLIMDAGPPGPEYAMGHAHCDSLSTECFIDGLPWIVNLGTYAYQDDSRLARKRSASHSCPIVRGHEQHECWAPFRVAKCGNARIERFDNTSAEGVATTYEGTCVRRFVRLEEDGVVIRDSLDVGETAPVATLHFAFGNPFPGRAEVPPVPYAPDFGATLPCATVRIACSADKELFIPYPQTEERNPS